MLAKIFLSAMLAAALTFAGTLWIEKLYSRSTELTFPEKISDRAKFRKPLLFFALTILFSLTDDAFLTAAIFLLRRDDFSAGGTGRGLRVAEFNVARKFFGGDGRRRSVLSFGDNFQGLTGRRRREINRGVGLLAGRGKTFERRVGRDNCGRAGGDTHDSRQEKNSQELFRLRPVLHAGRDLFFADELNLPQENFPAGLPKNFFNDIIRAC